MAFLIPFIPLITAAASIGTTIGTTVSANQQAQKAKGEQAEQARIAAGQANLARGEQKRTAFQRGTAGNTVAGQLMSQPTVGKQTLGGV